MEPDLNNSIIKETFLKLEVTVWRMYKALNTDMKDFIHTHNATITPNKINNSFISNIYI